MPSIPFFIFQKQSNRYRIIAMLEGFMPHRVRRFMVDIFFVLTIFFAVLTWGYVALYPHIVGMLFLSLWCLLVLIMLEAMYYSYRFEKGVREPYLFELSVMIDGLGPRDIMGDFVRSREGRLILLRAGFREEYLNKYRDEHVIHIAPQAVAFPQSTSLFESFVRGMYRADATFEHLLKVHGLSEDDFVDAAFFAMYADRLKEDRRRWWHADEMNERMRDRMMRAVLALERHSTMQVSHGAYATFVALVPPEEFSHDAVQDIFVISSENALANGRSVIVREDMVQE